MATRADQTVPGRIYRRTRNATRGVYFVRPKLDAAKFIAKLRREENPYSRDIFLMSLFKSDPSLVLMKRFHRGTDFITGEKWEYSSYVLMPADYPLRQVKSKPGFV